MVLKYLYLCFLSFILVSCSSTNHYSVEKRAMNVYAKNKSQISSDTRSPSSSINSCNQLKKQIEFIEYGEGDIEVSPDVAVRELASLAVNTADDLGFLNKRYGCNLRARIFKLRKYLNEKL